MAEGQDRKKQRFQEKFAAAPEKLNRSCGSKRQFSSKKQARSAARKLWEEEFDILVVYKCRLCGFHHIGHSRRTQEL
jgi:rubrerythrin